MIWPSCKIPMMFKDSARSALATLAIIQPFILIAPDSFCFIHSLQARPLCSSIIVCFFFFSIIFAWKYFCSKTAITFNIRGITVHVKQGDIFTDSDGWKLIPFNEKFETKTGQIGISKKSLNGKFLDFVDKKLENMNGLQEVVNDKEDDGRTPFKMDSKHETYPLGRIKLYVHDQNNNYMLLAFTHFSQYSKGFLSSAEYQQCLQNMWQEIQRTYDSKPIFLPLLGSGETRFENISRPHDLELLIRIISTLHYSGVDIYTPITIILTKEKIKEINLYELKRFIKTWSSITSHQNI